jgi:hypothetical protein
MIVEQSVASQTHGFRDRRLADLATLRLTTGWLRKGEPSGRFPLCMRLDGVSPLLATQKGALLKAFYAARRRVVPYLDTSLEPPLSERD